MKLKQIKELLKAEVLVGDDETLELDIATACGSDLMSDVLAFTQEKSLLMTGLTKPQVIRTAEMMDLSAVIFVRGKVPEQMAVQLAEEIKIPLLRTDYPLFEACGILYAKGVQSNCRMEGDE